MQPQPEVFSQASFAGMRLTNRLPIVWPVHNLLSILIHSSDHNNNNMVHFIIFTQQGKYLIEIYVPLDVPSIARIPFKVLLLASANLTLNM